MSQKTTETPARELPEQEQKAVTISTGGAATQNNLRNIRLIIGREYKNLVTQRSFRITSVILLILVIVGACVPTIVQFFASRANTQTSITVVNDAGTIAGLDNSTLAGYIGSVLNGTPGASASGQQPPFALTVSTTGALQSLQTRVKNGSLDILLVLDRTPGQDLRFTYYTNASPANDGNIQTIQTLAQQLNVLDTAHRLGLTSSQTKHLFAPPDFTAVTTRQSQQARPDGDRATGLVLAFAGGLLIYFTIILYGTSVAMGVGEEKGSRVMEILVNAATPFQLMLGKIIGIGAASLTQMTCLVTVGIGVLLLQTPLQAALFGSHAASFLPSLTGVSISFLLLLLIYFILGFLLYATLYAGFGALVKRQEEVQSAVTLPMLLAVSAWVLVYVGVGFPDAPWLKALSYVPFWTPTLMLVRIALGTVAWWEIPLTVAIMLAAILVCAWFAARLYRMGVLMYGQRPRLRQIVRLVRQQ